MLYSWSQYTVAVWNTCPLCQRCRIISCSITIQTKHCASIVNAHAVPKRKFFGGCLNDILICLDDLYKMIQRYSHQAIWVPVIKSQPAATRSLSRMFANEIFT